MDELQEKFRQQFPEILYLSAENRTELEYCLRQKQWIHADEKIVSLEKPGEGNMNVVLRVVTDRQRFIVKQPRPWVQKYPQVAAPMNRVEVETSFYELISAHRELKEATPKLIGFDSAQFILALEDLGDGSDFTYLYQKKREITTEEVSTLVSFISQLHQIRADTASVNFPDNRAMKELNHEHIFNYPFLEENGFNLDDVQPGLQEISLKYKRNEELKAKITRLGERYLATGNTLLHGDYYPGSWLKTASDIAIIDPEFAFLGDPEFDIGVMVAHLMMAETAPEIIQQVMNEYQQPEGYDELLQHAYSGVEVLRRIIGLAQLPLSLSLEEKRDLLTKASDWIQQY
ncbi:phosphotransferase [Tunicatimonas pelagia]|uniref:phosphotransferase n=1 Tax=Tunicatimonas pelagia TaxID=931531 RepID=UPI002666CEC8|nr:phosphotransferase [Tunicatimonas pelagia]WKN41571.1 phosphotransferase [Tunicatimonas pelagia]